LNAFEAAHVALPAHLDDSPLCLYAPMDVLEARFASGQPEILPDGLSGGYARGRVGNRL